MTSRRRWSGWTRNRRPYTETGKEVPVDLGRLPTGTTSNDDGDRYRSAADPRSAGEAGPIIVR